MKKIPLGIQDLQELINADLFYLDKTKVIFELLNTGNKYYFLSRPRRFGKSLTLSTIKYLYLGRKELFKKTWIFDHWDFEETYPVLQMSFAGYSVDQDLNEYIKKQFKVFIGDELLGIEAFDSRFELDYILQKIYEKTGKQTVIIVDEYDKGVLVNLTNVPKAEEMRNFFTSFYAGVKDSDDRIKLFMLTGLTKVLKMSVFSVLNNLKDLSFSNMGYRLMGYTEGEIKNNFDEEIDELAKKEGKSKKEILDKIRENYNGYNFGNETDTLYNPRNINNLFIEQNFSYYWADTGIPSAILHYIDKKSIEVEKFITRVNEGNFLLSEIDFKLEDLNNIKSEVLFTNAGYLTIKSTHEGNYSIGYPNKETEKVMNQFFMKLLKPKYDYGLMTEIADGLYEGITTENQELLEEIFEKMVYEFLNETAYEWTNRNPEGWFKTFLGLFLRLNNICYYPEVENLKGRKDFVIPVGDIYYILEAKVDKSPREAIEHINKKYIPQFKDGKAIVKVGLNWNRDKEVIEVEFERHSV